MSERKQFRAIKGTRDILPPDSALWNWFEHTAREVFESYNFGEIRLPIFEETRSVCRARLAKKPMWFPRKCLHFETGQMTLGCSPGHSVRSASQHSQTLKQMLREGI